ncbi:hypothetical protein ACPCUV_12020 [Streptomyces platensis]|uniref:hypothetical protein n=1 Tax=Streptomyces platensis TaxID=58346 RepID=UPI003C2B1D35
MPKTDHRTPCRQFLHPGEVLWEAREYTEYPDLPLVPAHLRAPRKRPVRKKGILGALGDVLDRASRPPSGTGESRCCSFQDDMEAMVGAFRGC